jgi:hypothetical protein
MFLYPKHGNLLISKTIVRLVTSAPEFVGGKESKYAKAIAR